MIIKPALLHFKFDGFVDLPSEVDSPVYSEVQTDCNGNKWRLMLLPGGEHDSDEPGCIALYLNPDSRSNESLGLAFSFAIKGSNGAIYDELDHEFSFNPSWPAGSGCGGDCIQRDTILDPNNKILKDGALCIDVRIQVKDTQDDHYVPESKLSNRMLKLLESGDGADASFKVGTSTFSVHSHILRSSAPILAGHLPKSKKKSKVIIKGISPNAFKLVLAFVYAEQNPSDKEILEHGMALIDAADRYELVDLKMIVEHVLVRERILRIDNVCDYILFADAKSCPLLKEYAVTYLILNAKDVLKSEYSKPLKESGELLAEILMLVSDNNEDRETLAVNELRLELSKRKLDVDGSKEVLISRLEEAKRQRTE